MASQFEIYLNSPSISDRALCVLLKPYSTYADFLDFIKRKNEHFLNDSMKTDGRLFYNYTINPKRYSSTTIERPTGKMGTYVELLHDYYKNPKHELSFSMRTNKNHDRQKWAKELARKQSGFSSRFTDDYIQDRFKKEGAEFYQFLLKSKGTKLITNAELRQIQYMKAAVKGNMVADSLLQPPMGIESGYWGKDFTHNFEHKGYKFKILSDLYVQDYHTSRFVFINIVQYDGRCLEFGSKYVKDGYSLRHYFHCLAATSTLKARRVNPKEYTCVDYWVVLETGYPHDCKVFTDTTPLRERPEELTDEFTEGKRLQTLLDKIEYYTHTGGTGSTKTEMENGGVIPLIKNLNDYKITDYGT